jgi:hypothetical protein
MRGGTEDGRSSAAIDLMAHFPTRQRHGEPLILLTAAHRCATIRARNRMNGIWVQTVRGK